MLSPEDKMGKPNFDREAENVYFLLLLSKQVEPEEAEKLATLYARIGGRLGDTILGVKFFLELFDNPDKESQEAQAWINYKMDLFDRIRERFAEKGIPIEEVTDEMLDFGDFILDFIQLDREEAERVLTERSRKASADEAAKSTVAALMDDLLQLKSYGNLTEDEFSELLAMLGIESINEDQIIFKQDLQEDLAKRKTFISKLESIGRRISDDYKDSISAHPHLDNDLFRDMGTLSMEDRGFAIEALRPNFESMAPEDILLLMQTRWLMLVPNRFLAVLEVFMEKMEQKNKPHVFKFYKHHIDEILNQEPIDYAKLLGILKRLLE